MANFKNVAVGIGVTAIASLATIPSFNGYSGSNNIKGIQSTGIYASVEEDEAESKKYMSYKYDILRDLNYNDPSVVKHLTDESPDAFSDKYLREVAERERDKGYKLANAKYKAMTGIGLHAGDYFFTEGFNYKSNWEDMWYVKATNVEYAEWLNYIRKTQITEFTFVGNEYTGSYYNNFGNRVNFQYDPNKEALYFVTFFG